ncbi:PheS-related mystery ligase SrmL [Saccharospirillum salsuginis]|uniref:Phenylalanyl-tRNA synthetase n=1 Tax=Saccharospirillum salsuginis TaxID=418750 RepID=A0A918K0X8_9GAMM|nr:hypothetical protein [Saccharospirillum salsuginis]GGX40311.1 hypothetical protein GCM10007392_03760 [Saccharospirillum salsuginis]
MPHLNLDQLIHALSLRDLSDPGQGPHAMQRLITDIQSAVLTHYSCPLQQLRTSPLVPVRDNYDALGYPADGPAREARYSRYVAPGWMLRTQTSTLVPGWLRGWTDKTPRRLGLITCGLVYRRDSIDRLHTGEPHQLDLWVLIPRSEVTDPDRMLRKAIDTVLHAVLPDHAINLSDSPHPYTEGGLQIDALSDRDELIEIGECGRIDPGLLTRTGWDPDKVTGIAMGLGLDRLLMLRKHLPDIRLLRQQDPRVVEQMQTLNRWRPVSYQPTIERDLSIATDAQMDEEVLGDRIREALPDRLSWLEAVRVLNETPYESLPEVARERIGMQPGQKNVLVRLTIRHPTRSITRDEANDLRNRVYSAIHEGSNLMLA